MCESNWGFKRLQKKIIQKVCEKSFINIPSKSFFNISINLNLQLKLLAFNRWRSHSLVWFSPLPIFHIRKITFGIMKSKDNEFFLNIIWKTVFFSNIAVHLNFTIIFPVYTDESKLYSPCLYINEWRCLTCDQLHAHCHSVNYFVGQNFTRSEKSIESILDRKKNPPKMAAVGKLSAGLSSK